MTDDVVDVLEAVEVDQHQRCFQSLPLARRNGVLERALEVRAVWNAGQFVMVCEILDVLLGTLAIGDVANDDACTQRAGSAPESGRHNLDRHAAAVLAAQCQLAVRGANTPLFVLKCCRAGIVRLGQAFPSKRSQFALRIAQHPACLRVRSKDAAIGPHQEYRVDAVLE